MYDVHVHMIHVVQWNFSKRHLFLFYFVFSLTSMYKGYALSLWLIVSLCITDTIGTKESILYTVNCHLISVLNKERSFIERLHCMEIPCIIVNMYLLYCACVHVYITCTCNHSKAQLIFI